MLSSAKYSKRGAQDSSEIFTSLLTQICREAAKEDKQENTLIHQIFKLQPLLFIKKDTM